MPGLVDAAVSIANSLGMIGASARAAAADLRDTAKAQTEAARAESRSSMARAAGGQASTMGTSSGSSTPGGSMTSTALATALQSLKGRTK